MIISTGNRTDLSWSPIWSVIIQVINKIGPPCSESQICLITSMITDLYDTKFCYQLIITLTKFVIYKALFLKSKNKKF